MPQTLNATCSHCGHHGIVVTRHDGTNYEGYCPHCRTPLFGFFILTEKAQNDERDTEIP